MRSFHLWMLILIERGPELQGRDICFSLEYFTERLWMLKTQMIGYF